jgi:chromosome segregation protein
MRLERLEIAGFKSFSDRAELSFDRGVTAIVGPNGCGKSNVADALTWVMGEQSAKSLRGEKMEDVIFSGSDARKPTGTAEVRLKLSGVAFTPSMIPGSGTPDASPERSRGAGSVAASHAAHAGQHENGHHRHGHGNGNGNGHGHAVHVNSLLEAVREVEVTRRLYRSGESEYLIDGQICRLRDIHELLMDTGLGAKAYAIIEQGKIGLILSSRPTDRRQLIEEAAGITKYKARRRAAELKLEAAEQNLLRIDDIVFEVEKQRASLKRQAAKARRFARLRDEMRRWEKVLFARRYGLLGEVIESTRARLSETREHEAVASGRLAEVEAELSRLRIELSESESVASRVREAAHARELEINRRQQQVALDRQQAEMLHVRGAELETERASLAERREPDRRALVERRAAAVQSDRMREESASLAASAAAEHERAQQAIDAAEADVDRARSEVHAVTNTVTALTAALEAASAQRERAAEALGRLVGEASDLRTEHERTSVARTRASDALAHAHDALDATRIAHAAREAEMVTARLEHEARARDLRDREHVLTGLTARLHSLEELDAHRAGFSDAARTVLVHANGHVGQMGALADVIEVEPRFERAVEACLGDLLQHVLVREHVHAAAGLTLVRREDAGRCGFVVTEPRVASQNVNPSIDVSAHALPPGAVLMSSVLHVRADLAASLHAAIGDAVIVDDFETARDVAARLPLPVATMEGDVLRGVHLVVGGGKVESRGILAAKREIKDLRERAAAERDATLRLARDVEEAEQIIAHATAALAVLSADGHRHEKEIVAVEARVLRASDDEQRLSQRRELVAAETRRVQDEIAVLDTRQLEARESIERLTGDRRAGETLLAEAQRALMAARESSDALGQRAAEARAAHAGLVERSAAVASDVQRMEVAALELDRRLETCASDLTLMMDQRERLLVATTDALRLIDEDVRLLEGQRDDMRAADDRALALKVTAEQQEQSIRDARRALDAVRALAAELDVTRATAEADLTHLAQQCLDAVNMPLDEVRAEVAAREAAGEVEPDRAAILAVESPEPDEDEDAPTEAPPPALERPAALARMTAEEAIAELRGKIDRLGPVNMMAIEQFSELDQRLTFLTTQRKDLVDSIAQTNEAIKRIDETTHARFREAFSAINANFQGTFSTLFGGGRAGLTLLDETDPLESGIDIVASPPGKRLQSVMLLSGGEKALTAIALMFAIFRYKPSPFCLLDEIDAPLDDANIGRFVEMLRGMLDRTQFIIITHNRKTMEIANRLYGVTMEEPGVSKLISLQLN